MRSLYFAELQSNAIRKASIYNLGDDAINVGFSDRIFDVSINGSKVLKDVNIATEFGEQQAVVKKFNVNAINGDGINIHFDAIKGEPILNAIRVYRNY